MSQFNPQRTFIHEVGHFVARELNKRLFKVGNGVEEIFILKVNNIQKTNIGGGTKARIPDLYNHNEVVDIPEYIAVLVYGCLFQILATKVRFDQCFCLERGSYGLKDAEQFSALAKYLSGSKRKEIFDYFDKTYISLLLDNYQHLRQVLDMKFENFIIEDEQLYKIDLLKLESHLADFFTSHSIFYHKMILDLRNICQTKK